MAEPKDSWRRTINVAARSAERLERMTATEQGKADLQRKIMAGNALLSMLNSRVQRNG